MKTLPYVFHYCVSHQDLNTSLTVFVLDDLRIIPYLVLNTVLNEFNDRIWNEIGFNAHD